MAHATDDAGLTEYERQRLAHVARNREYMARLGVLTLAGAIGDANAAPAEPKRRAPRVKREPAVGERRSARVRNAAPEFDGSAVDALADDEDLGGAAKRRKASSGDRVAAGPAGAGVWASEDAALEASRAWLEDARALMLARGASVASVASSSSEAAARLSWRREAVSRWGRGVPAADDVADWEAWVRSRIGTPPPPSDLQLLQEYYAHDAWQLLVACVLMSRVSSWATKHDCISRFFERFPTPTDALAAKPDEVLEIIRPLGLFPNRYRSVVEVSARVLDVEPLDVGAEVGVNKIYGVGEFGIDSFEVFARGNVGVNPGDKTLQSFVSWQKRNRKAVESED